jgi:hypothetical protein
VRIGVAPSTFAESSLAAPCRRRLAVVLSRYDDLVREVLVCAADGGGCKISVVFGSGEELSVTQARILEARELNYLIDRLGRAVARRVALGQRLGLEPLGS